MKNKPIKPFLLIFSVIFIFYIFSISSSIESFSSKKTEEKNPISYQPEKNKMLNTDIPSEGIGGTCGDNASWFLSSAGTLTVSGHGDMSDWTPDSMTPWSEYGTNIVSVIIGNQITSIGDYAFALCTKLQSVTFENGSMLLSIGEGAFSNCKILPSLEIPASVTDIGKYVFYNCSLLSSLELSENIINIGDGAFAFCLSMTSINVDENNPNYSSLNGVLYNKNKTEIIHFCAKNGIKNYTVPETVEIIGNYAFGFCSELLSVTVSSTVTEIGNYAFYKCNALNTVTIEDGSLLSDIGDYAFYSCESLRSINIPAYVSNIGDYAFVSCKKLQSITVDNNNNFFGSINGVLFNKTVTELILFPADSDITDYFIPSSVVNIGANAFGYCTHLSSVDIPSSVKHIESSAFIECKSLNSIAIPSSVISIGDDAFRYSGLSSVYFYGSEPTVQSASSIFPEDAVIHRIEGENGWSDSWNCYTMTTFSPPESPLSYIAITAPPTKQTYYLYEPYDIEGLVVTAYFENNTSKTVTEFRLSESVAESLSDTSMKIVYDLFGKTRIAATPVTVNEWPDNIIGYGKYGETSYWTVDEAGTLVLGGIGGFDEAKTGSVLEYDWWLYNEFVSEIIIKNGITSIVKNAFINFVCLESLSFEENSCLKTIGEYAFGMCQMLSSSEIPISVTEIESGAFIGCEKLDSIIIPTSVSSIGSQAFTFCPNLKCVYFRGNSPDVSSDSFDSDTVTVFYLNGTSGWNAAVWNGFNLKLYEPDSVFDLTNDGKTDILDVIVLKNNLSESDENDIAKYDANKDGIINNADIEFLVYYILNLNNN